ncbi:MAG: aminopeptidase [Nanoarchaeota archaeon]
MIETSKIVWTKCIELQPDELPMVVYDNDKKEIAQALANVAKAISGRCELVLMPKTTRNGEEPPEDIKMKMQEADAVVASTTFSLTHTDAVQSALKRSTRIITMPGITKDIFLRAIPIDYDKLRHRNILLAKKLQGKEFHIETKAGTDLIIFRGNREVMTNTGILAYSVRKLENLPAGEVFFAPLEKKSEGRIVIDGSSVGGAVKRPFKIIVENGEMVDCENKNLWKILTSIENGVNLAELGIGTNPKAQITGVILEDEKVQGTAHIAFGTNKSMGGLIQTSVHIDSIFKKPIISVDGKIVLHGTF